MIDYLLLLKFEDVSASADALELWKVVDTSVSELEIVWMYGKVHERAFKTDGKCCYFNRTEMVCFLACMKTVLTILKASFSSYVSSFPSAILLKKCYAMTAFSKARSTLLIYLLFWVLLWQYTWWVPQGGTVTDSLQQFPARFVLELWSNPPLFWSWSRGRGSTILILWRWFVNLNEGGGTNALYLWDHLDSDADGSIPFSLDLH